MKKDRAKTILVASMLNRREVLGFLGATAAVSLVGCLRGQSASVEPTGRSTQTPTRTAIAKRCCDSEAVASLRTRGDAKGERASAQIATTPSCVVRPQQTEGPYFVDEKLNRTDIRSDPSDGSVKQGVPLRLVFHVSQIDGSSCTPLSGATVDLWHCDAVGVYSDVTDPSFSTVGKKFLRGYQVTDANGTVEFMTIYPGWYPGRTVHIHFKIRTDSASQRGYEFTSQLYFDDSLTDQIHAQPPYTAKGQPPYTAKGQRTQKNDRDGIFRGGGAQLMLQLTKDAQGYVGKFYIGLQVT